MYKFIKQKQQFINKAAKTAALTNFFKKLSLKMPTASVKPSKHQTKEASTNINKKNLNLQRKA